MPEFKNGDKVVTFPADVYAYTYIGKGEKGTVVQAPNGTLYDSVADFHPYKAPENDVRAGNKFKRTGPGRFIFHVVSISYDHDMRYYRADGYSSTDGGKTFVPDAIKKDALKNAEKWEKIK